MSDLKNEMLKIKVKGYFDNGDLKPDPTITVLVENFGDTHSILKASETI